ncbi:MAG: hypothetical protein KBC57_03265 [Neisseriaceae bacterium]|nr:hypothetical protein [Neisseriaceae bacterium]
MESFREPMAPSDVEARLDRIEGLLIGITEMLLAEGGDDDDDAIDPSATLDDIPLMPLPLVMDDEL